MTTTGQENRHFEFEERYSVWDREQVGERLRAAGFTLARTETQVDHWFIPRGIMSPQEQSDWFDNQRGYALRIREESADDQSRVLITAKQVVEPGNHNNMTTIERSLTALGAIQVLGIMGEEFYGVVASLKRLLPEEQLSYARVRALIESAGRKEYITLHKERQVFRNDATPELVADVDSIPELAQTDLGFSASLELEYTGSGSEQQAAAAVHELGERLGYERAAMLQKALPGLAIPYLARF